MGVNDTNLLRELVKLSTTQVCSTNALSECICGIKSELGKMNERKDKDNKDLEDRISELENKIDNYIADIVTSREGNVVTLKYIYVDGTEKVITFEDQDTIAVLYDDTELREEIDKLKQRNEELSQAISDLEQKDLEFAEKLRIVEDNFNIFKESQPTTSVINFEYEDDTLKVHFSNGLVTTYVLKRETIDNTIIIKDIITIDEEARGRIDQLESQLRELRELFEGELGLWEEEEVIPNKICVGKVHDSVLINSSGAHFDTGLLASNNVSVTIRFKVTEDTGKYNGVLVGGRNGVNSKTVMIWVAGPSKRLMFDWGGKRYGTDIYLDYDTYAGQTLTASISEYGGYFNGQKVATFDRETFISTNTIKLGSAVSLGSANFEFVSLEWANMERGTGLINSLQPATYKGTAGYRSGFNFIPVTTKIPLSNYSEEYTCFEEVDEGEYVETPQEEQEEPKKEIINFKDLEPKKIELPGHDNSWYVIVPRATTVYFEYPDVPVEDLQQTREFHATIEEIERGALPTFKNGTASTTDYVYRNVNGARLKVTTTTPEGESKILYVLWATETGGGVVKQVEEFDPVWSDRDNWYNNDRPLRDNTSSVTYFKAPSYEMEVEEEP